MALSRINPRAFLHKKRSSAREGTRPGREGDLQPRVAAGAPFLWEGEMRREGEGERTSASEREREREREREAGGGGGGAKTY